MSKRIGKGVGDGNGIEEEVGIKNDDEDGESLTHNFRVVDVFH